MNGLGEDDSFWQTQTGNFTQNRDNVRLDIDYNDLGTGSLTDLLLFANQIDNSFDDVGNSILISHDAGGVLTRQLDGFKTFGGAITFGSQLDGMRLINAVENGDLELMAQNADEVLQRGPEADGLSFFGAILEGAVSLIALIFNDSDPIEDLIAKAITDRIVDAVGLSIEEEIDLFNDYAMASLLMEGDDFIEDGQNIVSSKPKLVVYGEEDSPVHIRLLSSAESDGQNDTELLDEYNELISLYKSAADDWAPSSLCLIDCGRKREKSEAYRDGQYYLETEFEEDWVELIGASYTETHSTSVLVDVCGSDEDGNMYRVTSLPTLMPIDDCLIYQTVTSTVQINLPNDGLIHMNTAVGEDSEWTKQNTTQRLLPGVNHFEMGEHEETRLLLDRAFNTEDIANGFFFGN